MGRPVSRVLSTTGGRFTALRPSSRQPVDGRSSLWAAASPRGSCSLPGARRGRAAPWIPRRDRRSCLALLPAGVTWPDALLRLPVVSYTTFSPSHLLRRGGALYLCGPIRKVAPSRIFSGAVLCGVQTFLQITNVIQRPSGRPGVQLSYHGSRRLCSRAVQFLPGRSTQCRFNRLQPMAGPGSVVQRSAAARCGSPISPGAWPANLRKV